MRFYSRLLMQFNFKHYLSGHYLYIIKLHNQYPFLAYIIGKFVPL